MKRKISTVLAVAVLAAACMLGACDGGANAGAPEWYVKEYYAVMNTAARLVLCGENTKESEEQFNVLGAAAERTVREIESSLSATLPGSSVAGFNAAQAGASVEIDQTAYEALSLAQSVYTLTEGYYNPAVYYNVLSYGFDGKKNFPQSAEELPGDGLIEKYNELAASFGELELKRENGKYYAVKPNKTVEIDGKTYSMKIDLGGIGKGYAVDKVNALIDEYGFEFGYFNFASSSIAFKTFGKDEPYSLHLINARATDGSSYLTTDVANACVSTSGDYENYFELEGVRYCHVFSPVTGKPVKTDIMTATIIGGSAAQSDALTTALMAMGKERAVSFINANLSDRRVALSVQEGAGYGFITNMPSAEYTVDNDAFTLLNTLSDGKIVLGE